MSMHREHPGEIHHEPLPPEQLARLEKQAADRHWPLQVEDAETLALLANAGRGGSY